MCLSKAAPNVSFQLAISCILITTPLFNCVRSRRRSIQIRTRSYHFRKEGEEENYVGVSCIDEIVRRKGIVAIITPLPKPNKGVSQTRGRIETDKTLDL